MNPTSPTGPRARTTPARRSLRRRALIVGAAVLLVAGAQQGTAASRGTTSAAACPASLQALLDATPARGTVVVPPCTYRESVIVPRPMTIRAAGAVVDGENVRPTGVLVRADDVTIDGLTVTRVKNDWHVGAVNANGVDRFTFRNGVIRDSASVAIGLHGGTGGRVLDSELTGCGQQGYFMNKMTDTVFARNRIHHNNLALAFDWGVEAGGGKTMDSSRITFDGNEVAWNRGRGIWFDGGARDVAVTNNRVHDNDLEGIFFEISSGARISGNAVWGNGYGFAVWGWGAGISVSSSDRAEVVGNTVAWNARGISVISQGRELAPNDHNTVHDNVVVSAAGDRVAGWYDDKDGSLFDPANANTGHGNHYWIGYAEPTDYRFEWDGGRSTLAAFNATPGEEGGIYLTPAERDAALAAAGIPGADGAPLPSPLPGPGDVRIGITATRLGSSGVPATISWPAVAIATAYQVQLQEDGGAWKNLQLASPTSRSAAVTLSVGHQYRARLRYRTPAATWSAWSAPTAMTASRYEESTSLGSYRGTWRRVVSAGASGGAVRAATAKGATAAFRFTGRAVAWIAPVGPARGSARVYVDGVYQTTVSLYRAGADVRRVVYRAAWASRWTHTLEIRVVGTPGHPRVDVDAFAVLR